MGAIVVGKLGKTHGLKGWIRLYSFTEPAEQIFSYPLSFENNEALELESWKQQQNHWLVKPATIDTIDDAQALVNKEIFTDRSNFPEIEDGSYYWHDLAGCHIIDKDGNPMGTVSHVTNYGAHDILCVNFNQKEHMIPYVKEHVLSVDIPNKTITVQWKYI